MKNKKDLALILLLIICFVAVIYISALCYKTPDTTTSYVVKPGDTVWQIATEHCPNYHTGNVSMKIQQLNDIDGYIYPGEVLIVPVEEGEKH
jgi:nucleoid-associated protein YgaU